VLGREPKLYRKRVKTQLMYETEIYHNMIVQTLFLYFNLDLFGYNHLFWCPSRAQPFASGYDRDIFLENFYGTLTN